MADKITTSSTLKLKVKFVDGDDRTLTLDDPKTNLTAEQINALGAIAKNSNILIGDKAGADFDRIETAFVSEQERIALDLR